MQKQPNEETLRRLNYATKHPLNRRDRKRLAKEAGLTLNELNQFAVRRAPAFMGIKQFKKINGGKLPKGAKDEAWSALRKYNDKLRDNRLQREGQTPELSRGSSVAQAKAKVRAAKDQQRP